MAGQGQAIEAGVDQPAQGHAGVGVDLTLGQCPQCGVQRRGRTGGGRGQARGRGGHDEQLVVKIAS